MKSTNPVISICIPTRNRPDLLAICIASCLENSYRPIEILVGDDSDDDETERWIYGQRSPAGVVLTYSRNERPLGQSGNVNRLFNEAQGGRVLLLHDDDRLLAGGLDLLADAWMRTPNVRCVYGKQFLVEPNGLRLFDQSRAWNDRYFRTAAHVGLQPNAVVAALRQQVPNDGYLVESALVRRVRFRPESEVGQCVDADFAVRLAQSADARGFVFINDHVSEYRLTPNSIARAKDLNRREDLLFESMEHIGGDAEVLEAKKLLLSRISVGAALDAAMAGRRRLALRIMRSQFYQKAYLSRWTLFRLVCVCSPGFGRRAKRYLDQVLQLMPNHQRSDSLVEPDVRNL